MMERSTSVRTSPLSTTTRPPPGSPPGSPKRSAAFRTPPAGPAAHGPPDLVHEIGARQHGAPDPVPAQEGQLVGQERDVEQRDDRLRARVRHGAQARTFAPGQDDGGYVPGVQGCASLMSITGMPSRIG